MAETDKTTLPDGTEQPAPEAQADNLTAPASPDIVDASGDVVIPSNVIDGLFEEKRGGGKRSGKASRRTGGRNPGKKARQTVEN